MKNFRNAFIVSALLISSLLTFTNCEESDPSDLIQKYKGSYEDVADIEEALSGLNYSMYVSSIICEEGFLANILSDEMFGGGDGAGDAKFRLIDKATDLDGSMFSGLWDDSYSGIYIANNIIASLGEMNDKFANVSEYNQILGEAYFMRAFLYFRMAKFYGGLPINLSGEEATTVERSAADDTYGLIASDFKMAIELLPDIKTYGKTNKFVAEAYLARVFLLYTGVYSKEEIALPDGAVITKADVVNYIDDVINNSGYALVNDFRNLWPYSYCNSSDKGNYYLAMDNDLEWVGQESGTNTETMFLIDFGCGDFQNGARETNRMCVYQSVPEFSSSQSPFGTGWGMCPVATTVWDEWSDDDLRKVGSIIDLKNTKEGSPDDPTKGDRYEVTTYINKKYTNVQYDDGSGSSKSLFHYLLGCENNIQLSQGQDWILMRYADVLLMHSELTGTADGINQVRARVGLESVAYSLEALQQERKHEFAFEGLRWFDILRWGTVSSSFSKLDGISITSGGEETSYSSGNMSSFGGLLPIPESVIEASGGLITQNPQY